MKRYLPLIVGSSLLLAAAVSYGDDNPNNGGQVQANCASDEYAVVTVSETLPSVITYACNPLDCVYVKSTVFPFGWLTQKYDIFLEKDGFVVGEAEFDNPNAPNRLESDVKGMDALNTALQGYISKGVCKKAVNGGSVVPRV